MREADAVLLLADDAVARIDVPALAKANGWSLSIADAGDHLRFLLEKAPVRPAR
jgi:TusA-related sulfurtransferase